MAATIQSAFHKPKMLPLPVPLKMLNAACGRDGVVPCCQNLPLDNGGLAETKYCHALHWLLGEWGTTLKSFSHTPWNSELDEAGVDFILELTCGCRLRRQVKSSNKQWRNHKARVRHGEIDGNIVVDVVPPRLTIHQAIQRLRNVMHSHKNTCRVLHGSVN